MTCTLTEYVTLGVFVCGSRGGGGGGGAAIVCEVGLVGVSHMKERVRWVL